MAKSPTTNILNTNMSSINPTGNTRMANKILTEADDHHMNNFNLNIHNYNNINKFILSSFENDPDYNERIVYLRNIVDKAPKLNLEVKFKLNFRL